MNEDIEFMKKILPEDYTVNIYETKKGKHYLRCISTQGIRLNSHSDSEDEEHWEYILRAIRHHFGMRFLEVYHNVCSFHLDFEVKLND